MLSKKARELNDLPYIERVRFFATHKVTAGIINTVTDGKFERKYVGKIGGFTVSGPYLGRVDAVTYAREFREHSRNKLKELEK